MSPVKPEDYTSGRVFLANQAGPKMDLVQRYAPSKKSTKPMPKFKKHTAAVNQHKKEKYVIVTYHESNFENRLSDSGCNSIDKAPDVPPPGSIVLNEGHPERDARGRYIHDVYIDPFLARNLRPHQVCLPCLSTQ